MVKKASAPKAKPGRGGDRAYKKTVNIDKTHLADEIRGYVQSVGCKVAFEFDEYNTVWGACAVRGKALAANYDFIMAVLSVDPSANIVYTIVKEAVSNVLCSMPESKPSKDAPIRDQAALIASRAVVIQSHLRRMALDDDQFRRSQEECAHYPELATKLETMRSLVQKAEFKIN
jgi:hypothetical protein